MKVAVAAAAGWENPPVGFERIELGGVKLDCGVYETDDPEFNAGDEKHRQAVLVQVDGFSCNYRDRAQLLQAVDRFQDGKMLIPFGSDFVGRVIEIGHDVENLATGDRVFANNDYPCLEDPSLSGLVSAHCSRQLMVLPAKKLAKVPADMSDHIACSFTLNGQTVFAILRKLDLVADMNLHASACILAFGGRYAQCRFGLARKRSRGILTRTYHDPARWGKVVYRFES